MPWWPKEPNFLLVPKLLNMKRLDGRTEASQLRAFSASQSLLNRADGSAKFSFGKVNHCYDSGWKSIFPNLSSNENVIHRSSLGDSTAVVSVVGPAEVKIRDEKMDEATVELIVRPAVGFPCTKDKVLERSLRQTIEPTILAGMMPRTLIQIVVQIEQEDGNMLSTAVNAISLAMLDAGLPMNTLVASVSAAIDQDGNTLLDPNSQELEVSTVELTLLI
jgi:exosome complex component RRP46